MLKFELAKYSARFSHLTLFLLPHKVYVELLPPIAALVDEVFQLLRSGGLLEL
jgi:hypothetical protein